MFPVVDGWAVERASGEVSPKLAAAGVELQESRARIETMSAGDKSATLEGYISRGKLPDAAAECVGGPEPPTASNWGGPVAASGRR